MQVLNTAGTRARRRHAEGTQKAPADSPMVFWVSMEKRKAERNELKPRKQVSSKNLAEGCTHQQL
jgi:hypothetical protein